MATVYQCAKIQPCLLECVYDSHLAIASDANLVIFVEVVCYLLNLVEGEPASAFELGCLTILFALGSSP